LLPLEETLELAFLRADRVEPFDLLGVVIKLSTELLLSLSVGCVDRRLSLAAPVLSLPSLASSFYYTSLWVLMESRILFDFHWVHRKL
jgi:hypothetical protein